MASRTSSGSARSARPWPLPVHQARKAPPNSRRPNGVDDRGGGDLDLDLFRGRVGVHGSGPVGDQDAGGSPAEQVRGGRPGVLAGEQVGEVLGAHLDGVGPAQDPADPVQVGLSRRDGAGAAVRVEHHQDICRGRDGQALDAGPGRLHDQAEGADVQRRDAGGQDRLGRADGGRGGLGQVEVVAGHAGRVDVHQGQRGGLAGRVGHRDSHAVALQVGAHQLAEAVTGQPSQEGGRLAEPGHGAGHVERPASHPGIDVPGLVDDQVDQGLTRDSDHGSSVAAPVTGPRSAGRAGTAGTRAGPGRPSRTPGASDRRRPDGRPRPPR